MDVFKKTNGEFKISTQKNEDLKNPVKKWMRILNSTPWTHEIGINPRSPYLDELSIQTLLNDYILPTFQWKLFGWKAVKRKRNNHLKYPNAPRANFILFPEFDHANGYWHAHGYAQIETKEKSNNFLNFYNISIKFSVSQLNIINSTVFVRRFFTKNP